MSTSTTVAPAIDRDDLVARHLPDLREAVDAARARSYHSRYSERITDPAYGDDPIAAGQADFEALQERGLRLDQPSTGERVAGERSPYGPTLAIDYPASDPAELVAAAKAAMPAWRDAGPDLRAALCVEILDRLGARAHELGQAVHHTTGQPLVMAFQAGGPHALDRGLEAVAYAWDVSTRHAASVTWEKPGKRPTIMEKRFHVVPRGVEVTIGCRTFPTWNGLPGIMASLATGNPVIIKPHPGAVLPLGLVVEVAQEVLGAAGFSPHLVTLATDTPDRPLAIELATNADVKLVDFTGSTTFGDWLEANATQAEVYTEKAGVNTIVVDGTDQAAAMFANLAFSFSLYSGQMCTTPQAVFVPRDGIDTDEGHLSFEQVGERIAAALEELLEPAKKGVEILGAIGDPSVVERIEEATGLGRVVAASTPLEHPAYPDAVVHTPLVVAVDAADADAWDTERFGPISFLVATDSTEHGLELVRDTVKRRGAITFAVYAGSDEVRAAATEVAMDAGVSASFDLHGSVFVNQTSAFSDFHATGANPAANASLVDDAFVASRFRVVETRWHA
ncbi:MAG: phenylacetic acid degradation protein PaaN [Nitriliruptor sp.]|uniref:phenylacetic acid degradation protein PaaN n=1 Tax=Nitriliruptor sp. TaxID=2448056 RepID=UPI00349FF77E